MVRCDCKYWQPSCDMCGITGDDQCPRKCKDFELQDDPYLEEEDW